MSSFYSDENWNDTYLFFKSRVRRVYISILDSIVNLFFTPEFNFLN